ncbi:hypothetical protein HOS13_gp01 [Caulobacter phage Lullwater]|uniref:Uncharacterized protein n=1 Tax=Caulobacter phage Lullwater TaxID=2024607 RepID=A0A291LC10_9CAUD|nr:hypothetical protein HOS13_gp01 [Caulobacter phage Lullwater]ATI16308.1 hypothetical protein Lull_001 [Caulobacter phage Lullwater]
MARVQQRDIVMATKNIGAVPAYSHLAMSADALKKNLAKVRSSSKAFDKLVHSVAVACLIQALPEDIGGHNNATPIRDLMNGLSDGASRLRVKEWAEAHSNVRINVIKDKAGKITGFGAKMVKAEDTGFITLDKLGALVLKANDTPFWAFSQESTPEPMVITEDVFARRLAGFLKALDKAKQEDRLNVSGAALHQIDALRKVSEAATKRAERLKDQAGNAVVKAAAKAHKTVNQVIEQVA